MNWIRELKDLYDKNADLAGAVEKGRFEEPLILAPIFHTTVTAQITVTINSEGMFLYASQVEDKDKLTLIPVFERSAGRTSTPVAHPLCDNLKYLAGDYRDYVDFEKECSENYRLYMAGLEQWATSSCAHEKVIAIWQYLKKGSLMKDLIQAGVLLTDDNGMLLKNIKIQNAAQSMAFVRFRIEALWDDTKNLMEEKIQGRAAECWLDKTLHNAFIEYMRTLNNQYGLSYLTGENTAIAYLHPKKIRNEGDGSKLISSNDNNGFTYRGRFADEKEVFAVGYEDSQKVHNALRWIIRKQGRNWNGLYVVSWESDLKELPDWCLDTDMVCDTYESMDIWGDQEKVDENQYKGTNPKDAYRFQRAIAGYGKTLEANSQIVLMAFDAATTGRLAMMECQALMSSKYLAFLQKWYEDCGWIHPKFKGKQYHEYYGIVGIRDIAEILYGTESKGMLVLKGNNEKMPSEVCKRLLPCVILGRSIPMDMVQLAVERASSPAFYESDFVWARTLALACSLVKKKEIEKNEGEEWTVALNAERRDRNYLYGRLLAVADRIEYRTFDKDEKRETNAKRFMRAFSQDPFRTWKIIEEKITPYKEKLEHVSERLKYEHLIDEICWLFEEGDFEKSETLNGIYLLGFHNQSYAFRKENN